MIHSVNIQSFLGIGLLKKENKSRHIAIAVMTDMTDASLRHLLGFTQQLGHTGLIRSQGRFLTSSDDDFTSQVFSCVLEGITTVLLHTGTDSLYFNSTAPYWD